MVTNVSDPINLNATIYMKNANNGLWYNLNLEGLDIVQENETSVYYQIKDNATEKIEFLENFVNISNNNSVDIMLSYVNYP